MTDYQTAVVQTAVCLASRGIAVFPAQFRSKIPKAEFLWKRDATTDPLRVPTIFSGGPWSLAVVMGPRSGIMDVEPDDAESSALVDKMMADSGVRTVSYRAKRGIHRWFRYDPTLDVFGKSGTKAGGLELRLGSDNNYYSICPPSIHATSGEYYEWLPGCAPWEIPIAAIPESLKQYFIKHGSYKNRNTVSVDAEDDGYLPSIGVRHDYLLRLSKLLYCDLRMPRDVCAEIATMVSQRIGTFNEPGRGALEVQNLFKDLVRSPLPQEEFADIDFTAAYELASDLLAKQQIVQTGGVPEIPNGIFCPRIETISQHARLSGLPRNLWLMTLLTAACHAMGNGCKIRANEHAPCSGLQMYTFGVGASGTGKSQVLNRLLRPYSDAEHFLTDSTPEALTSALARNPRGVLVELAEGRDFFAMFGRYNQGPGGPGINTTTLWHKGWSGDRLKVLRQKGAVLVPTPHICVAAAIQRSNLSQMPQSDMLDGLLQRILLFPIGRTPKKTDKESQRLYQGAEPFVHSIIERLMTVRSTVGQPSVMSLANYVGVAVAPLVMTLDAEAQHTWNMYRESKVSDQAELLYPEDHPWRSDQVRHAEMALRVAAGLYAIEMAADVEYWQKWAIPNQEQLWVPRRIVQAAISLVEWAWLHKQILMDPWVESAFSKLSAGGGLHGNESIPEKMHQFAEQRQRRVERTAEDWTLRDYYRCLNMAKDKAEAEVADLLHRGVIVQVEGTKPVRYRFVRKAE